jgi:hypothetical protein
MKAINPATGELIREYPEHTAVEVEDRLRGAERVFSARRRTSSAVSSGPGTAEN